MADDTQTPVSDLSYEQARDELVRLVARIESGEAPLEESMVLWERGEALAAHCQAKLDQAQSQLDAATASGAESSDAETGSEAAPGGESPTSTPSPPESSDTSQV
ncbi:MAG: exodeoxyribonuclease VII small subunit [Ornithinimicrobium sp.]|uniref:exodeoxyribonuclease VII small subunit n=1 Tax=Ornithinimicrobium sp. TaxID=1977084 RepID=UPI003D9B6569